MQALLPDLKPCHSIKFDKHLPVLPYRRAWQTQARGIPRLTYPTACSSAAGRELAEFPVISSSRPASSDLRSAEDSSCTVQQPTETEEWRQPHADFAAELRGKLILAPLTKGGNVPFRRLCVGFGAEVTMSEMVFARQLLKGHPGERVRLRRAANETCFGVQFAANTIDEGLKVAKVAKEAGARWVDLNCGCPIYEATRRGLGAALLRKPTKLARLVEGIASATDLPLTVKIRTGKSASEINAHKVVAGLQQAGATAITIHGRTMEQRYTKAADWDLIAEIAAAASVPIIGNGDILTVYEVVMLDVHGEMSSARRRMADYKCSALMVGRGALIKPWIFEEWANGGELNPTAQERVGIYRSFVAIMKEYFGDDAKGRDKAFFFLPWHFSWFHRYRPFAEAQYGAQSEMNPLIGTRFDVADEGAGESLADLSPLEQLLRCSSEDAHLAISATLWDSNSDAIALAALERLASSQLPAWEEALRNKGRDKSFTEQFVSG